MLPAEIMYGWDLFNANWVLHQVSLDEFYLKGNHAEMGAATIAACFRIHDKMMRIPILEHRKRCRLRTGINQ
jgi:hypothetical protein